MRIVLIAGDGNEEERCLGPVGEICSTFLGLSMERASLLTNGLSAPLDSRICRSGLLTGQIEPHLTGQACYTPICRCRH